MMSFEYTVSFFFIQNKHIHNKFCKHLYSNLNTDAMNETQKSVLF